MVSLYFYLSVHNSDILHQHFSNTGVLGITYNLNASRAFCVERDRVDMDEWIELGVLCRKQRNEGE